MFACFAKKKTRCYWCCNLLVFFHRTLWNLGIASPGPRDGDRDGRITWARLVAQFRDSVGTTEGEILFSAPKAERMGLGNQTAAAIFLESLPEWSQHRGRRRWEVKWDGALLAQSAPEPIPVPSSSFHRAWAGPFTCDGPARVHCFSDSPLSPASLSFFLFNGSFPRMYKHAVVFPSFFFFKKKSFSWLFCTFCSPFYVTILWVRCPHSSSAILLISFSLQPTPTSLSFCTTQLKLLFSRLPENSTSPNRRLRFQPSYHLAQQRHLNIPALPNASVYFVHLFSQELLLLIFSSAYWSFSSVSIASSFYLLSALRVEMLQGSVLCPGSFLSMCTPSWFLLTSWI